MRGKWKQNNNSKAKNKKKKGNAVLQKYMVAVDEFIKSKGGEEEAVEEQDHGLRHVKKKSRKELRKEKRKLKKAKMKSHYEGNKTLSLPPGDAEQAGTAGDKQKKKQKKKKTTEDAVPEVSKTNVNKCAGAPKEKPGSKKAKKVSKLQESRKMALMEANEQEDREIKKLERCLGLNKRKNKKTIPQSFVADGLDYILGMLDSGSMAAGAYDSDDDMDMAKEKFKKLEQSDSEVSDEEDGEEMVSGGSDEEEASLEEDDDDQMDEEEEEADKEEEEIADDDEEEMEESDEGGEEEEEEEEEEGESSDPNTESKPETVSW